MYKKCIFVIILVFTMLSCVSYPNGLFPRSSTGNLLQSKNIYSKKRLPLRNTKYINQAKHNLIKEYNNNLNNNEYDLYQEQDSKNLVKEAYIKLFNNEIEAKANDIKNKAKENDIKNKAKENDNNIKSDDSIELQDYNNELSKMKLNLLIAEKKYAE